MRVGPILLSTLAAIALAGCGDGAVVRIVDGRAEAGRFISEPAYALYARGAEAEAAGNIPHAIAAYGMAAVEDPDSPEIWTRLGALYCRAGPADTFSLTAEDAFARAQALDPRYGPAHRERARCLLAKGAAARGSEGAALAEAERALALDPDDLPTVLVHAAALERAGRGDDARLAYLAAAVRRPSDREAWAALLDFASARRDAALAFGARERVAALAEASGEHAAPASVPLALGLAHVDAALRAGDLAEAQRRATKARLPAGELAVRAAALGRAALAHEQASLVLGADPSEASARIALAAAADLLGDTAALDAAMRGLPHRSTPPSPLATLLLAEVLARRVGVEAARAWLGGGVTVTGDDPVLAAEEKRVREALSGAGP